MAVTETIDPPGILLTGEIDITCAEALRSIGGRLASALTEGQQLPVDVADVTFIDSSGVGALVAIRNVAITSGGSVVLRNPSMPVRRLFELSGLTESFLLETDAG